VRCVSYGGSYRYWIRGRLINDVGFMDRTCQLTRAAGNKLLRSSIEYHKGFRRALRYSEIIIYYFIHLRCIRTRSRYENGEFGSRDWKEIDSHHVVFVPPKLRYRDSAFSRSCVKQIRARLFSSERYVG